MASWDEDSVTMALEAGRQLLHALPDAAAADLTLASSTLPFADRLNAGIAASALGLASQAALRDVGSSARAALTELAAERRIARPASSQEMIFGDGAAGALVGSGPVIATHVASRSTHAALVDHFRPSGEAHDYGWEECWVRDEGCMKIALGTLQARLLDAGVAVSDIAHFVMPAPLAKVNDAVAKRRAFTSSERSLALSTARYIARTRAAASSFFRSS